jgi:hypothetical protein
MLLIFIKKKNRRQVGEQRKHSKYKQSQAYALTSRVTSDIKNQCLWKQILSVGWSLFLF